jgi:hypothetical protein
MQHSYVELTAPDMTLDAMNDAERRYIRELAQSGDLDALRVVFRSLLADPSQGARQMNLSQQVRWALISATYDAQNGLARETLLEKAEMVQASLLREASASPLEHLLIERAVTCWLAAELADIDAARQDAEMGTPMLRANLPSRATVAEYFAKRQERAHRRFLQSLDALARMRRLMSPLPLAAGQVNIAAPGTQQVNQLNIATPTAPAPPVAVTYSPTWPPKRGQ